MKLMTKAQEDKMIKNAKDEGVDAGNSKPVIKLFGGGAFTGSETEAKLEPDID